ncbi:FAD:protein FMN transferase [Marinoscillum furvescens]|uniref:FAD:protein FMN transferase n=1 Tax=Marinoscillum furvescens DSM 4134 TaxID=1122208 RepID=A0A3D9LH43_MARFU|nr:FAD:protein FMN transferase [Marinoscillum furvescens]REE05928.1 thiamine biosynthesis lipoprotein [Marinoscillum furvescens DSM 4134]
MDRKWIFRGIVVLVVLGALYRMYQSQPEYSLTHVTGQTMGTIQYNVKYLGDDASNHKKSIDSLLVAFNQSLSTYIPNSEISTLNQTGRLSEPSALFIDVLAQSKLVYETTDGAFDPTVGPLVNAWGFGPDKLPNVPDSSLIAQLRQHVGFHEISYTEDQIVMDTAMYLDFSATAKGLAVDVVAEFLETNGYENYMVEIGGEVRAAGKNDKGEIWKIGIEDPTVAQTEQRLLAIVALQDRSMATSGNYRNYYEKDGRIIAHTIDPRTGYNTTHNLLSASVFAEDCMTADAYATAFMVLGVEASKQIVRHSEMEAFLIFQNSDGTLGSYVSEGLQSAIQLNKIQ